MKEVTFTTKVEQHSEGIDIVTIHDQTGSTAMGFVPNENIADLIKQLTKIVKP